MTHIYKWTNKFADVFISSINLEREEVSYTVRDKETGVLVEPLRKAKFIVNEPGKLVHFDAREMPIDLFSHIYQVLQ